MTDPNPMETSNAPASTSSRRRGRAAGLSREAIIEAALRVIDEHGISGLTMRRLGAALGVDAMAIYWHFDDKAAVLNGVVDHQAARLAELRRPLPTEPIELMVAIAKHFRRVLLEHPNLAPILASRPLPQEAATVLISYGVSLLRSAGFRDDDIPLATAASATFGLGFALQEAATAVHRTAELGRSFREQQKGILALLRASDDDTAVEEAAIEHRLAAGAREEDFERGLRAMLAGLRAGLGDPVEA
jgi:AcrR family transcriptional regulator